MYKDEYIEGYEDGMASALDAFRERVERLERELDRRVALPEPADSWAKRRHLEVCAELRYQLEWARCNLSGLADELGMEWVQKMDGGYYRMKPEEG